MILQDIFFRHSKYQDRIHYHETGFQTQIILQASGKSVNAARRFLRV